VGVSVYFISRIISEISGHPTRELTGVGREHIGRRSPASLSLSLFLSSSIFIPLLLFVPRREGADSLARGTQASSAEHPRQFHVDGHPDRLAAAKVVECKEENPRSSKDHPKKLDWRAIMSEAYRGAACSREWPRIANSRDFCTWWWYDSANDWDQC